MSARAGDQGSTWEGLKRMGWYQGPSSIGVLGKWFGPSFSPSQQMVRPEPSMAPLSSAELTQTPARR